jgi:hypothetical protein
VAPRFYIIKTSIRFVLMKAAFWIFIPCNIVGMTLHLVTKIFVHFYSDFTSRFLKKIRLFPYPIDFVILYGSME